MKWEKEIDFGEYKIVADYDDTNGSLTVTILDEVEGVIEMIKITNDGSEDEELDDDLGINTPNLN